MSKQVPATTAELKLNMSRFEGWLNDNGAEILALTNEWERVRFRAEAGIGIIYSKKTGQLTYTKVALEAMIAFVGGNRWNTGRKYRRHAVPVKVRTILQRDHDRCFYCDKKLEGDFTIEHLVARTHQGPNHISNLFPSCLECNQRAGNMSAPEKIRLRDEIRTQTSGGKHGTGNA